MLLSLCVMRDSALYCMPLKTWKNTMYMVLDCEKETKQNCEQNFYENDPEELFRQMM